MTESKFTAKLLRDLRTKLQRAVILKHCNPYTSGVPDFSVTLPPRTEWFEVKITNSTRGRKTFDRLQLETAKHMHAWYIIWSPPRKAAYLFRADELDLDAWWEAEPLTYAQLVEQIARFCA